MGVAEDLSNGAGVDATRVVGFRHHMEPWAPGNVLSDTQVGSSGAPVFDEHGRLIAVHHKGGRPQEVAGKMPTKKNEGIRSTAIVAGLKKAGLL